MVDKDAYLKQYSDQAAKSLVLLSCLGAVITSPLIFQDVKFFTYEVN